MWARVVEFMLACWMALSPFIFGYPADDTFLWINDYAVSLVVAFFALISFYPPLKKMHLCNLPVSVYLIVLAYKLKGVSLESALQSYMVLGILFLMLAIVPTDATAQPVME